MSPSTAPLKFYALAGIASLMAIATGYAGPVELATVAAVKLSEAPNYSWTTTVDDDARTYVIDGQTNLADKSDISLVNLPMVASVRRKLVRSTANSDNLMIAAYSGDEKVVIQTPDGWRKPEQLTSTSDSNANSPPVVGQGGMGPMMGRRGRRGMGGAMGGNGYPSSNGQTDSSRPPSAYSNLQLTLSRPHEELGIIIAGYTEIKADGDTVIGTLSETAAKLLLVHAGQKEITPLTGSGTFQLWVKDGAILKYEVKLEGTLAVKTNGNRHEVTVHQTATTEIKSVGTTKFDVPDEAKKKLGVAPAV